MYICVCLLARDQLWRVKNVFHLSVWPNYGQNVEHCTVYVDYLTDVHVWIHHWRLDDLYVHVICNGSGVGGHADVAFDLMATRKKGKNNAGMGPFIRSRFYFDIFLS